MNALLNIHTLSSMLIVLLAQARKKKSRQSLRLLEFVTAQLAVVLAQVCRPVNKFVMLLYY